MTDILAAIPRRTQALITLLVTAAALAASASHAEAVTCYGHYCSGKDPQATGCSADGNTYAERWLWNQQEGRYRVVELRWSKVCKTNWARMNVSSLYTPSLPKYMWVTQKATNYTQWYVANNGTYAWTRQIYSPTLCVFAGATLVTGTTGNTACA